MWGAYARLSRLRIGPARAGGTGAATGTRTSPCSGNWRLIRAYAAEHGLHLHDELVFCDNGRCGWQKPGGPAAAPAAGGTA